MDEKLECMASLLSKDAQTFNVVVCCQVAAYNLLLGTPCRIDTIEGARSPWVAKSERADWTAHSVAYLEACLLCCLNCCHQLLPATHPASWGKARHSTQPHVVNSKGTGLPSCHILQVNWHPALFMQRTTMLLPEPRAHIRPPLCRYRRTLSTLDGVAVQRHNL